MKITVIAACTNSSGESDFACTEVEATSAEIGNGDHLEIAKEQFKDQGFEGPFVLFDPDDVEGLGWDAIKSALQKTFLGVK